MDDTAPHHSDEPGAPSYASVVRHDLPPTPHSEYGQDGQEYVAADGQTEPAGAEPEDDVVLQEVPSPGKDPQSKTAAANSSTNQQKHMTEEQQTETKEQGQQADESMGTKNGRTALQRHCDFFDPDGDGVVYPWDTFFAFYVLGFALPLCLFAAFAINVPFSWPTAPRFPLPDLLFGVHINNIALGRHGSDTGAYDQDGLFDENRFELIFKKNAQSRKDAMSLGELFGMLRRNRVVWDPFGWSGAILEWVALYLMIWPKDNYMSKEDIRGVYDGSLFYKIAKREKKKGRLTPPGWQSRVRGTG